MQATSVGASWHDFLASQTADDLLMVANGQRLHYARSQIRLHWLDGVSLALIRQAYASGRSLAVCYPVPVCNLAMLAAAQLLVYDFVANAPGTLSVLLVSRRTEVREHYINLRIGTVPLASALPLARIRSEQEPAMMPVRGTRMAERPRLYHLSQKGLLDAPWPSRIGAIVVDHSGGAFDDVTAHIHELAARNGASTVIHLLTDPFASSIQLLRQAHVPIWIWDHLGLKAEVGAAENVWDTSSLHPFGTSARQFENVVSGICHHTIVCENPAFEAAAERVWDDLRTVQQALGGMPGFGVARAIKDAYGAFYTMLQMLVPLPVYEEEARGLWGIRPVNRRISDLQASATLIEHEAPDLAQVFWPSLILDLKDMHAALANGNAKYSTLVQQVRDCQRDRRELVVVCPNRATKRMLELCLRAREGLHLTDAESPDGAQFILLSTFRDIPALESADAILFPGQYSYGRRHLVLTAAAPEIRYLAYPGEADRIERQVPQVHQLLTQKVASDLRDRCWSLFGGGAEIPPAGLERTPSDLVHFMRSEGSTISSRSLTSTGKFDLALWTPFSTDDYDLEDGRDVLTEEDDISVRPIDMLAYRSPYAPVSAVRVEFTDGYCYAEPGSSMTLFLPSSGQTDDRIVNGLRTDDLVIFVDSEQQRHLYEAILERVEHHPAMGATYQLARYWHYAIREGFARSRMTYEELLRRLRDRGSRIGTSVAIHHWVSGRVLGPRDEEDIRRIGEVLNDEALITEWKAISRAIRKVRALHLSLAGKLSRIALQAGLQGRGANAADECIDSELGLYVDDFRDSVAVHRVVSVGDSVDSVPYAFTGRFYSQGMELKW